MPVTSKETPRMRCSPPSVLKPGFAGSGTRALFFVISNSAADNDTRSSLMPIFMPSSMLSFSSGSRNAFSVLSARPVVRYDKLCADGLNDVLAAR